MTRIPRVAPEEAERVRNEERLQHRVILTRPFRIGRTEVTVGEFRQFVAASGPAVGKNRMVRGGGWHFCDLHCRSAYRNNYSPTARTGNTGFRVVRTLNERR